MKKNYPQQLKKDADKVIQRTKIKEFFSPLGKAIFVGSYALDLMCRPDIDLFVIDSKTFMKNKAIEVTKKLIDSDIFQTVGFANCFDYKCPDTPQGFYWELIYELKNTRWKFDIWYVDEAEVRAVRIVEIVKKRLAQNPDARQKILQKKKELYDGVKYKDGMNGFKIYESVLGKIE